MSCGNMHRNVRTLMLWNLRAVLIESVLVHSLTSDEINNFPLSAATTVWSLVIGDNSCISFSHISSIRNWYVLRKCDIWVCIRFSLTHSFLSFVGFIMSLCDLKPLWMWNFDTVEFRCCRVLKLHVWLICRSTRCTVWRWRWGKTRWSMSPVDL